MRRRSLESSVHTRLALVASLIGALACFERSVVSRPLSFLSSPDGLYVLVSGRWEEAQGDSATVTLITPLNSVEVECHLNRRSCVEARTNLDRGDGDSDFLFAASAEYEVVSSSDSIVVARAMIGVYETELRIDLGARSVQRFARWVERPREPQSSRSVAWVLR